MVFIRAHLILIGLAAFAVTLGEGQGTHGEHYHHYTKAPTHHTYSGKGSNEGGNSNENSGGNSHIHHHTLPPNEHHHTYKIPGHNVTHTHRYKIPGHRVSHEHRVKIPGTKHHRGEEVPGRHGQGEDVTGVYYLINLIYNYFAVGGKLTGVPPVDLLLLRYYVAQGPKNFCPNK